MTKKITITDIEKAIIKVLDKRTEEQKRFDEYFERECKNNPKFAKAVFDIIKKL